LWHLSPHEERLHAIAHGSLKQTRRAALQARLGIDGRADDNGSLSTSGAHAEACVPQSLYGKSLTFDYQRCQMTDLDQKRESDPATNTPGIPNHGKMHCVPAAASEDQAPQPAVTRYAPANNRTIVDLAVDPLQPTHP
jgi:hypothetical protein